MTPYTRADAEHDMAAALEAGDVDAALTAAAHLDHLGARPTARPVDAACWYAGHGLPVFPLQGGHKIPYPHTRGVHDATTDPAQVAALFANKPDANIGVATGHLVDVIDFDGPQSHADWGDTYADWASGEVDVLGTVSTPRAGGLHVYIRATGGGNRAGFLGRHVDYRGVGGYVVAPPSRTDAGTYRWLRPLNLEGATS